MASISENSINIAESAESIKRNIEKSYCAAIDFLEGYTGSLLRHAGNHKLFYIGFVQKFQTLYYYTHVESNMKKTEKDKLLLKEVEEWLDNGITKDPKKGIKLFTEYSQALFDKGILSFKR